LDVEGLIFALLLLFLVILGLLERRRHIINLGLIPICIHVNGSRGKSTVTRLIAGGLREAGFKVLAKTTGTSPRLIFDNGQEVEIERRGKPSIKEQMNVVAVAAKRGVQALVVECMAIHPECQWTSEHRMLRSTIGVITNIRKDHLDVMGPTLEDIARAQCYTLPKNGTVVTAEKQFLSVIIEEAAKVGTKVIIANPEEIPQPLKKMIPPLEFEEDIAIALKVCEQFAIKPEVALQGMLNAQPDPGALRLYNMEIDGKELLFVNAFAANDPTSAKIILEKLRSQGFLDCPAVAILNNRKDRVHRAQLFSTLLTNEQLPLNLRKLLLVGTHTGYLERCLIRSGFPSEKIMNMGRQSDIREIMHTVFEITVHKTIVIGMGNAAEVGQALVEYWEKAGKDHD
jgi:poly-gamma-glutamate synthase PgsB/CapB